MLCFLSGCDNQLLKMTDEYNSYFKPINVIRTEYELEPDEEGFNEKFMLQHYYLLSMDSTFSVSAPEHCQLYRWRFFGRTKDKTVVIGAEPITTDYYEIVMPRNVDTKSRELSFYTASLGVKEGTYLLELTVADLEGNFYSDKCEIIIYKRDSHATSATVPPTDEDLESIVLPPPQPDPGE
ncbi:MAG: hypothetical protein MJ183_10040 [Treponemataceae bacterium]|nr:hypothetical protein [Treponemataceae bacterium]